MSLRSRVRNWYRYRYVWRWCACGAMKVAPGTAIERDRFRHYVSEDGYYRYCRACNEYGECL